MAVRNQEPTAIRLERVLQSVSGTSNGVLGGLFKANWPVIRDHGELARPSTRWVSGRHRCQPPTSGPASVTRTHAVSSR